MDGERRGGMDVALVTEEQGGGLSLPWLCPLRAGPGWFIPSALGLRDDWAPPTAAWVTLKCLIKD